MWPHLYLAFARNSLRQKIAMVKSEDKKVRSKKSDKEVRKLVLELRVNEAEVAKIKSLQQSTTERSLNNYVRKVILQKPVVFTYRNLSTDDFLKEMLELKKQLNAVGKKISTKRCTSCTSWTGYRNSGRGCNKTRRCKRRWSARWSKSSDG